MHSPITVSIQGRQASFHEIAALSHFHEPITLLYRDSFEEVFQDLVTGTADKIFVATSNTTHGAIEEVERLIKTHNISHEGTYVLPIDQHLLGVRGASASDVRKVVSHPVALSQCKEFFEHHPNAEQVNHYDTAAAVKYVGQLADPFTAAIGSSAAARLYGLKIIKRAIQDNPNNATTFKSFCLKEESSADKL